jgi:RNA polymerase sigma-70 factor (ECF subfamily)
MGNASGSVTSLTLLGRLRRNSGDQEAWGAFVDRYGPRVYLWCQRWGLQEADARDVTQDVMLELTPRMGVFEYRKGGSFRAWLKTVTHRTWCDFVASKQRGPLPAGSAIERLAAPEVADDLVRQFEEESRRELLEVAMAVVQLRVHPHTWQAFVFTAIEGKAGADVAEQLNMKIGTVWVARSKVKKMLQDEVRRLEDDEGD